MTPSDIVSAVQSVIGTKPVALHVPFIDKIDVENVTRCAEEEPVGYSYIRRLEEGVAARVGRKYAVAVSSGTAALHLALRAVGISPDKKVLMPVFTFAGAAAAVRYCGAWPIFVSGHGDAVVSFHAVMGYDWLGYPTATPVGDGPPMVADAAAALGSIYADGRACGSIGDVATISFNNNKIVTTNGGGMVLTDSEDIAVLVRHLATTAKHPSPWFYDHDMVGFNYRMSNLGAALAVGQLARLDEIIEQKAALAARYRAVFGGMLYEPTENDKPNYWMNAITVGQRDETLRALTEAGISCRALYTPLCDLAPYRGAQVVGDIEWARHLWRTTICLPSGRMPT